MPSVSQYMTVVVITKEATAYFIYACQFVCRSKYEQFFFLQILGSEGVYRGNIAELLGRQN